LGVVANFASVYGSFKNVATDRWGGAEQAVAAASAASQQLLQKDGEKKSKLVLLSRIGEELSSNGDRRLLWMELLKSLQEGLRHDPADALKTAVEKPYDQREEFHITKIDSTFVTDLKLWFQPLQAKYAEGDAAREELVRRPKPVPVEGQPPPPPPPTMPEGAGWVIQMEGYHYFNGPDKAGAEGAAHVRKYLIDHLQVGEIELPGPNGEPTKYSLKELGVSFPVIAKEVLNDPNHTLPNPEFKRVSSKLAPSGGGEDGGGDGTGYGASSGKITIVKDENGKDVPSAFKAPKCSFVVEFAWQEKTLSDRKWWRDQPTYDRLAIPPQRQAGGTAP
jgi:type IV pilus assembly protein PilM